MLHDRFTARIEGSVLIAQDVPYPVLVGNIVRYTVEAAVARSSDASLWQHEQLRRKGLAVIACARNAKAIWTDAAAFSLELNEARREGAVERFESTNELNPDFYVRLDVDVCERWRRAGYDVSDLTRDMRVLFAELERDAADRAADAKNDLIDEILVATESG